jgi:hypothetical protein
VLEVDQAHAANAEPAKSQTSAIHRTEA